MDHYVIRVDGLLTEDELSSFSSLQVTPETAHTVLTGDLADQAALSGVLDYLGEIGVQIVEVLKIPAERSG